MPERADPACRRILALLIIYYSSITQPARAVQLPLLAMDTLDLLVHCLVRLHLDRLLVADRLQPGSVLLSDRFKEQHSFLQGFDSSIRYRNVQALGFADMILQFALS